MKRILIYLSTPHGQNAVHVIYSIGAAIVILGALFKLTHLPGANPILYLGLGTEVMVFILSAFDLPNRGGIDSMPSVSMNDELEKKMDKTFTNMQEILQNNKGVWKAMEPLLAKYKEADSFDKKVIIVVKLKELLEDLK